MHTLLPICIAALGLSAALLGLLVLLESRRPRVVCLMYHRLASDAAYQRTQGTERIFTLPASSFERQIAYLCEAKYRFLSAPEVESFIKGTLDLAGPAVMVTFDDGCRSIAEHGVPILERYGACATVFQTTDSSAYVFQLGAAGDPKLEDEQIRKLDGRVLRFGAHGVTHRPLRGLPATELHAELVGSRQRLEALLNRAVTELAIPGNWHNREVLTAAREAGYTAVWCSNPGTARPYISPFGLPRINIEGQLTLPQFIAAISPWGIAQRRLLASIKRLPGRLLGPRLWLPIRAGILRLIPGRHLSMRRMILGTGVLAAAAALAVLIVILRGLGIAQQ